MSEESKILSGESRSLSEKLKGAVKELPEYIQAILLTGWMNEAIGAKKVCDMAGIKPGD